MRQLQKLVARTDCGLGALERDLATMEASALSSRQVLVAKTAELDSSVAQLAAAEARAADLYRQLQQVRSAVSSMYNTHVTSDQNACSGAQLQGWAMGNADLQKQ